MSSKAEYSIFDKIVEINFLGNSCEQAKTHLLNELSLYQKLESDRKADIVLNIVDRIPEYEIKLVNPSIHKEIHLGFIASYPKYDVAVRKIDSKIMFDLALEKIKNPFIKYLKKLNNMQYEAIDERVGHVFFESVLIPAAYFDINKFIIHSSAFQHRKGGAVLVGGTGGVGKTSLEIELCMNRGYSFISDDLAVIDKNGNIYPNLSFPKIYGYNIKNNKKLKNEIFKDRTFSDRLAWNLRSSLLGDANVRRKISPKDVYKNYVTENSKVKKYFILFRENREDIKIERVRPDTATDMSLKILQSELTLFNNHILWHEFNSFASGIPPILTLESVLDNWKKLCKSVMSKIDCFIISIPLNLPHREFVDDISDIIDETF